jgi:hypothetical protein
MNLLVHSHRLFRVRSRRADLPWHDSKAEYDETMPEMLSGV